jgi:NmrA-like family
MPGQNAVRPALARARRAESFHLILPLAESITFVAISMADDHYLLARATKMMMMNRDALYEYSDDENDDVANDTPSNVSQARGTTFSYGRPRAIAAEQGRTSHRNRRGADLATRDSSFRSRVSTDSSRQSVSSQSTTSSASCETTPFPPEENGDHHTIALFGGTGNVGQAFLHRALDAGYQVRHFVTDATILDGSNASPSLGIDDVTTDTRAGTSTNSATNLLQMIVGSSLYDTEAIEAALLGADFVVCLLNDTVTARTYPSTTFLTAFVKQLYPLMKQVPSIQLFLLQVRLERSSVRGGYDLFRSSLFFPIA